MTRFRETRQFGPTVQAAAESLGISPTAVEKDYWVSEVLRVLVTEFPDDFVFKGGTSLSKGYGIVERFSEDIDILVLPGNRGRGSVDKLMKKMGAAAAAGVSGHAISVAAETGRHRAYSVGYPATRPSTELITTSVLLEMGVRGGSQPNEPALIGSLIGDVLVDAGVELDDFEDLMAFEVHVLHPARTLLEKLAHIHATALKLSTDDAVRPPARSGRHFYDMFQLLGDDRVLHLLADRVQVKEVIDSIDDITNRYFAGSTGESTRPSEGFASSPAFDLSTSVSERLQQSYEATMPELHYGSEPLPTWDAICERVHAHAALL